MKKRKAMKSSQKEVSIEVSISKCCDKKMQVKRLRKKSEFAVNQLKQAISKRKEKYKSYLNLHSKSMHRKLDSKAN